MAWHTPGLPAGWSFFFALFSPGPKNPFQSPKDNPPAPFPVFKITPTFSGFPPHATFSPLQVTF